MNRVWAVRIGILIAAMGVLASWLWQVLGRRIESIQILAFGFSLSLLSIAVTAACPPRLRRSALLIAMAVTVGVVSIAWVLSSGIPDG